MLRLSDRALADLDVIADFIEEDAGSGAASEMITRILDATDRLAGFPRMGRPGRRAGTRELVVEPYVVVYRVLPDAVSIETVLHGRQSYP